MRSLNTHTRDGGVSVKIVLARFAPSRKAAIQVERVADEEDLGTPDSTTDEFEFADGLKVVAIIGPPSGSETYIGFAPVEGE